MPENFARLSRAAALTSGGSGRELDSADLGDEPAVRVARRQRFVQASAQLLARGDCGSLAFDACGCLRGGLARRCGFPRRSGGGHASLFCCSRRGNARHLVRRSRSRPPSRRAAASAVAFCRRRQQRRTACILAGCHGFTGEAWNSFAVRAFAAPARFRLPRAFESSSCRRRTGICPLLRRGRSQPRTVPARSRPECPRRHRCARGANRRGPRSRRARSAS